MALALNNLKRVDMPLNKETKPNLNIRENFVKFIKPTTQHKLAKMQTETRQLKSAYTSVRSVHYDLASDIV